MRWGSDSRALEVERKQSMLVDKEQVAIDDEFGGRVGSVVVSE